MKRNHFFYIFFGVLSIFSLYSCEIEDSDLDQDILNQFNAHRNELGAGSDSSQSTSSLSQYSIDSGYWTVIGDKFVTSNQLAVKLDFSSLVDEYITLISENSLNPTEALNLLSKEKPSPVGENANFVTCTYSSGQYGKKVYLYVVGLSSSGRVRGIVQETSMYLQPSNSAIENANVFISSVSRMGDKLSWSFSASGYPYEYVVLFEDEAKFANKLSDAALILFMRGRSKSVDGQLASKIRQMSISIPDDSKSVFIATHVNAYGSNALTVQRFFSNL